MFNCVCVCICVYGTSICSSIFDFEFDDVCLFVFQKIKIARLMTIRNETKLNRKLYSFVDVVFFFETKLNEPKTNREWCLGKKIQSKNQNNIYSLSLSLTTTTVSSSWHKLTKTMTTRQWQQQQEFFSKTTIHVFDTHYKEWFFFISFLLLFWI